MKQSPIIPVLTLFLLFAFSASAKKVDFTNNLAKAKKQAAAEGKPYFIDFMASWCMPCRWMDETTFSDPQVSNYINQNFIAVKVDIDDFDGFALKQQYNVKLLPTILFFDANGKLLAQYEESLAPTKMLKILSQWNKRQAPIASPFSAVIPSQKPQKPQVPQPVIGGVAPTQVAPNVNKPRPSKPFTRPALPPSKPTRPTTYDQATRPTTYNQVTRPTSPPVVSGEGLFKFSAERIPSSGFSVQIGAFGEYGNVLREVAKLEQLYDKEVIVHITNNGGKMLYKVLLGAFPTKEEAIKYQQQLKAKKVVGIIKDLTYLR